MPDGITSFSGDYRWLSNFHPCKIKYNGLTYPSVEHAYQAAKVPVDDRIGFLSITAAQAKHLGRRKQCYTDWNYLKVPIMRKLLQIKFAPHSKLADKLIATAPAKLIEGNYWGDTFWGVCRGQGKNTLGVLLMQQRQRLIDADCNAE